MGELDITVSSLLITPQVHVDHVFELPLDPSSPEYLALKQRVLGDSPFSVTVDLHYDDFLLKAFCKQDTFAIRVPGSEPRILGAISKRIVDIVRPTYLLVHTFWKQTVRYEWE